MCKAWSIARMPGAAPGEGNTEEIARVLFSEYLLPFELASILLLVAVVGSVIMLVISIGNRAAIRSRS